MKVWIAILLFAGTLFAQHAFTPEEIAEGSRLFQSNCTGCHGSAGDQVQGIALMSGKFRRATNDDEVAGIIRKRRTRNRHAGLQLHGSAGRHGRRLPQIIFRNRNLHFTGRRARAW